MNSIRTIRPYRSNGGWAFDDASVGLVREPFVAGVPEMIDRMVAQIPGTADEFVLTFSDGPFPGAAATLEWLREEIGGNWYRWRETGAEGWLCPALFKYFEQAPREIHLRIDPPAQGGDTITVQRSDVEALLEMLEAGQTGAARDLLRSALYR